MKIELINCESGDWEVLKVDGTIYHEGHHIPDFTYHKLLKNLGAKIKNKTISDEDMENGKY
jgi:hypothetical protein